MSYEPEFFGYDIHVKERVDKTDTCTGAQLDFFSENNQGKQYFLF